MLQLVVGVWWGFQNESRFVNGQPRESVSVDVMDTVYPHGNRCVILGIYAWMVKKSNCSGISPLLISLSLSLSLSPSRSLSIPSFLPYSLSSSLPPTHTSLYDNSHTCSCTRRRDIPSEPSKVQLHHVQWSLSVWDSPRLWSQPLSHRHLHRREATTSGSQMANWSHPTVWVKPDGIQVWKRKVSPKEGGGDGKGGGGKENNREGQCLPPPHPTSPSKIHVGHGIFYFLLYLIIYCKTFVRENLERERWPERRRGGEGVSE